MGFELVFLIMRRWLLITLLVSLLVCGQTLKGHPLIWEFLPNPTGDLECEWIELYNPTDQPIDISEYRIADKLAWHDLSDTSVYLPSGGYIVVAQDVSRFQEYYQNFAGLIISPDGWPTLNNDGDVIRLGDKTSLVIDSVIYDKGFSDNRSWERYIDANDQSFWGGSFASSGSTPGEPNSYFYQLTTDIDISISPDPFSPDGDGFEDETVISYNFPESESFDLAIYDLSGHRLKTFFDDASAIPGERIWDGRGDDGRRLPVGIYIVLAKIRGDVTLETKRTVVIAR